MEAFEDRSGDLSRRVFFGLAASGIGALLAGVAVTPASAAESVPSPTLPGEYWRREGQTTRYDGTVFDNICVRVNGDPARLYVPRSIKPGQPTTVVWFYHGAGSDHNALDGGFKTTAERVVDFGAIAICQNAGGTIYSHPRAQALQVAGYNQLAQTYPIHANVLRATSAGGTLAVETYAADLIPKIVGMYNVNATYDLEELYSRPGNARASIIATFGDDPAAIAAANPARHPSLAWAGTQLRVVVSQPESSDLTVPPSRHGLALRERALPTAVEASLRTHTNGHNTPGFADADFVDALRRWVPPIVVDATPPSVAITSPKMGAVLSGVSTLVAKATDDIGVRSVDFSSDGVSVGTATKSGDAWSLALDTATLTVGRHLLRATAVDAAGNKTTSAWIAVRTESAPAPTPTPSPTPVPPTVSLVAPAPGSIVSGTVVFSAAASSPVGIAGVTFMAGTRRIGTGTPANGLWSLSMNSRTSASPNGAYAVTAIAVDANGLSTTSAPVTITVRN